MLRFRFPEIAGRRNFRNDAPRPQAGRIDIGYCLFRRTTLLVTRVEDCGTVARAAVVALAVQRRGIGDLEEELEQIPIGRLVGVEDDLDRLSVGAMISVGRMWHVAIGIADSGRRGATRNSCSNADLPCLEVRQEIDGPNDCRHAWRELRCGSFRGTGRRSQSRSPVPGAL